MFRPSTSQTAGDRLENLGEKVPDEIVDDGQQTHANQNWHKIVCGRVADHMKTRHCRKGRQFGNGSGQVSFNLLYWKKNIQTEICVLD